MPKPPYRNARQLYADMELEAQGARRATIPFPAAYPPPPEPPRPQTQNPFVRLWQWFKKLVRAVLS
ncbi:MAG: hypothetical protein HC792_06540 [Acaryochloridaceae cyanobacterium CSU_5_19]|nr:hypothetical protein [Acaryochloridaceae cyanobacterium CSU_5_19]